MKNILGLDIGTNSIGGALINIPNKFEDYGNDGKIEWIGSRIIPIDGDSLQKFESGSQVVTKAANRRSLRGVRRLKHRYKLRRTRLIKVFKILEWVSDNFPEDFKKEIHLDSDFKFNISDYLPFKKDTIKEAEKLLGVENKEGKLSFSEDWIVYYLRKKALYEEITLSELARIIYMMNQRRGFKSGRKDRKDENDTKKEKFVEILTIESVKEKIEEDDNTKKSKDNKKTYIVKSGNYEWEVKRYKKPDWEGQKYQFLITKENGEIKYPFRLPKEDEWELVKTALEQDIKNSKKEVGEYFFDNLRKDKNYKIRQRVIDRSLYKKELSAIWEKQSEFHPELKDKSKLEKIAFELYKINKAKQKEILTNDLFNVIANDIIYYQRDLKSQKKLIGECRYEKGAFTKEGKKVLRGHKVAPKSSPEFQEFRIWQDIHTIRIIQKEKEVNGKTQIDIDVTNEFINNEIKAKLFKLFDTSTEVSESAILKAIDKDNLSKNTHKINLFAIRDKLKGNETKSLIRKVFSKYNFDGEELLNNKDKFYLLWHILYSISSTDQKASEKGIKTALNNPKNNFNITNSDVIESLSKLPDFTKQYASYSSKAINKLLQIIRCNEYWKEDNIIPETKNIINKMITGEDDECIDTETRDKIIKYFKELKKDIYNLKIEDFQGLPTWVACYVVYGKHSERENDDKYESAKDIDIMKLIQNNSLRNPIVEQVIRETLNVVKDVWLMYGQPDEIHIELARELKKNEKERKRLSDNNLKNFADKERIKKILYELATGEFDFDTRPNPDSPRDIEKFRIYENCSGVGFSEYEKMKKEENKDWKPNEAEIRKYALWISQKCLSPYTGNIIPLGKLFSNEYEVEHIIPQSKLKYDALDNLVISESGVNKEKGDRLASVFMSENSRIFENNGNTFTIFSYDDYVTHCKSIFKGRKLKNLLRDDIPEDFISRQLNDTRYITRKLAELLYPIAKEKEGIVFTGGSITSELKREWGLNTVWKEIVKPRFERLEKILGQTLIIQDEEYPNNFHLHPPDPKIELKRIDHRHHALDALIIAATTREHIRFLNSLSSADSNKEIKEIKLKLVKGKIREFKLPWVDFTKNAKEKLNEVIISFKTNNKVVTKPKNKYRKWVKKDGKWVKDFVTQKSNNKWLSVRKSMFKEPLGIIFLKELKRVKLEEAIKIQIERIGKAKDNDGKPLSYVYDKSLREQIKMLIERIGTNKIEIMENLKKNPIKDFDGKIINKVDVAMYNEYASKRIPLDPKINIEKIPYSKKSPLAKLLREHLNEYKGKSEEAFIGEGLDLLYKKTVRPIKRITRFEEKNPEDKFKGKYVETDKGGIVYFVIYEDENGKRDEMFSLSVHQVIERMMQEKPITENKDGYKKIILSPNDLVYVPTPKEIISKKIDWSSKKNIFNRIYKMVSSSGKQCFFVPHFIAKSLEENAKELGANNKAEKSWDGIMIKQVCKKIKVDRLGNIIEADGKKIYDI